MAGHVTNLATKFEHPMPIRSWFMSYNVSLWLPLRMCTRALRMRRITWPVSRGSKTITFLECPTPICLYNFFWATTTIKGRLLSSVTNAKALNCVNFLCVTLWPWPLTFWSLTFTTHGGSRDQPCHQVLKTLRLFFHELRVITFPVHYHWKCVRRPFCFKQIIRWKLKIRLGNRAHRIQHASIMLKRLVPHFYPKMHLDDYWRPFFRNPSRLWSAVGLSMAASVCQSVSQNWSTAVDISW